MRKRIFQQLVMKRESDILLYVGKGVINILEKGAVRTLAVCINSHNQPNQAPIRARSS